MAAEAGEFLQLGSQAGRPVFLVSYKVCLMNCGPVFTCGTCQGSWSWLQWVVVMSIKYVAKIFNKAFVGRPGLISKILASML